MEPANGQDADTGWRRAAARLFPVVAAGLAGLVLPLAVSGLQGSAGLHIAALMAGSCGIAALAAAAAWRSGRTALSGGQAAAAAPSDAAADMSGDEAAAARYAAAAIEATPNPVLVVDAQGRVSAANNAARLRFGLTGEQPRFDTALRQPDLIDAVAAARASAGVPRTLSLHTHVPVERFERVSVAGFDGRNGRAVLVSVQDETEARMSERMRADFLANASHELRTPLAGILGYIETLRGPAKDDAPARERFLEIMQNQAERMARLIADLLSLSRIELNEHVAPTGRVDLAAAVCEAVEGLPPERQARVEIVGADDPAWVVGDWDEIQQIVFNLIDNSLKYGRAGAPVRVRLSRWLPRDRALGVALRGWERAARLPLNSPAPEPGRHYAVLRVEDEGPGIERRHLPRLAERFYRVEDTAVGKSGTGLGLAIVKHVVNRHRGGLGVESEPGRGAAFAVWLPQPADMDPAPADGRGG